jgi:LEA14-like dessication related protein
VNIRLWIIASVAILAAACSSLVPKLETPDLQVVGIEVLRGDFLQQQLKVRMRVTNPNDRALPVRSITYQMQVAGEAFAHGESQRDFEIPARGTSEFDVSVTANAAGALLKLLSSGARLDAIDYKMTGRVMLASGLLRNIPFEQKGVFKLR